jgi:CheY-like chemotaxis protein
MALILASQHAYDVIFLDVQMPGMDGFELCSKIHETLLNRSTPVVFVTSQSDFGGRAQSILSGGSDLMAKPFLTFEITVKALTFILRGRLQGQAVHRLPATVLRATRRFHQPRRNPMTVPPRCRTLLRNPGRVS